MGTIAEKLQRLQESKADIRAAIVAKGQSVPDTAPLSSYGDKIRAIQTGADTSDATAAAGDILSGKTAYAKGAKVTGTMAKVTQATPSVSVSSAGLITASATQAAGYVASGTMSATKQLTTQAAATITPGTAAKTAVAAGRYTTGAVTVAGDANLVAENIKAGVSIFGVAGTAESQQYAQVTINTSELRYGDGSFSFAADDSMYHSVLKKGATYGPFTLPVGALILFDINDLSWVADTTGIKILQYAKAIPADDIIFERFCVVQIVAAGSFNIDVKT